MKADGTGAKRLTPGGKEGTELDGWTRDGTRLIVSTNKDNPSAQDAALIDVASGKWTMVTHGQGLNSGQRRAGKSRRAGAVGRARR